ncbi:MAG: response regulator, partial [Myxococcales bacterium]|nr:response regulator [Myxococcales bacterium]
RATPDQGASNTSTARDADEVKQLRGEVAHLRRRILDCAVCLEKLEATRQTDQYHALFEQSADAILIISADAFVDCNRATVEMLRYGNKAELLRTHPSELSPPFQPDGRASFEKANEMMALAFEKGSHRFEWDHVRATGEVFPVEVLLTAVPEGKNQILHVVWRDITERKELEEQLRQAQKMEAVGKLAGGIAHDFNNLLVAILGHAELLDLRLSGDSELKPHVFEIRRAGERAAELTRQLLTFSRKQLRQLRVIDLNAVLLELERLLSRLIGEDIELRFTLADDAVRIKADTGQIEQVVINLVTNARDAMPAGGTIEVETAVAPPIDLPCKANAPEPERYVRLVVRDNGIGMDAETRLRAFEPFFTTKPLGSGSGLGLSTVYGIVKQSGGEIAIQSSVGQGTCVTVLLPITSEELEPEVEPCPDPDYRGVYETILVVEDDPAVSKLIVEVLSQRGYSVHHAPNGVAALRLVRTQKLSFDLLLTDVVMPLMGGPELARRLAAGHPQARVVFMSGYANDALEGRSSIDPGVELIAKPFSPRALLERVRSVLDRDKEH